MTAIPIGLCQCGCGQNTRVVEGKPNQFIFGHQTRIGTNPTRHLEDGAIALILTHKGKQFECVVDAAEYPLVQNFRWGVLKSNKKKTLYARSVFRDNDNKIIRKLMHSFLIPDASQVDHKDHNGLNNRRLNLRPATNQQNSCNKQKRLGRSTPYIGVSRRADNGKFRAVIGVKGRVIRLGQFDSADNAARARDAAALKYHGEFAALNFPVSTAKPTPVPVRLPEMQKASA